jgi:hypothetical protein
MKIRRLKRTFVLVTIASATLAIGCELIVDFDRTTIPSDAVDATLTDVAPPEASTPDDAGGDVVEPPPEDAAPEAEADAMPGGDAGADAADDGG